MLSPSERQSLREQADEWFETHSLETVEGLKPWALSVIELLDSLDELEKQQKIALGMLRYDLLEIELEAARRVVEAARNFAKRMDDKWDIFDTPLGKALDAYDSVVGK